MVGNQLCANFGEMEQQLNNKLILYSSLFITVVMGVPKLLSLQHDGVMAKLSPFNLYEWLLQIVISFLFCMFLFNYNKKYFNYYNSKLNFANHGKLLLSNISAYILFAGIGGILSRLFVQKTSFPLNGYFARLLIIIILIFIELKVLATLFYAQQKEKENNQLRLANMNMELELLKAQLNPHFFFNALSSLSAVVRENPQKAQGYISHLSKIFRYSLNKPQQSLVTLKEELDEIISYGELMKMRHEEGFDLSIKVDTISYQLQLPHLSIQPIIENALKHNIATVNNPLKVIIKMEENTLIIYNEIQPKLFIEASTGIGLINLNERFKILLNKEIEIDNSNNSFTVKLPLK